MLAATLAWLALLVWTFMMLVGEWDWVDWVGASVLGCLATGLTVPLCRRGLFRLRWRWAWARYLPAVAGQIFVDFWIVTRRLARAVARGEREVGSFVGRSDFPTGGHDAAGTAWRAFVTVASTWSANSYVVDIDPDTHNRLSHDLVPNRASERPA